MRIPAGIPIDVWIERVLRETLFSRGAKVTSKACGSRLNYFGAHGVGYAQAAISLYHAEEDWELKRETRSID